MTSLARLSIALSILATAAACSSDSSGTTPCTGVAGTCVGFDSGASESSITAAFATATDGTTLAFGPGTFHFSTSLDVAAAHVTVRGAGSDSTVLDFGGNGSEGILATADHFTLQDLAIRDTGGNGVKVEGASDVTIRKVHVSWTSADLTSHGGYGIYPVQSHQVLVEDCFTSGATDTGIYVGQSQDIVVRNNEATGNVAGIEIENCYRADVHDNTTHGNTGGILVFDLPGLQQQGGNTVRVFDNVILDNDHPNFAPAGTTLSLVPAGAGVVVMANHDVEIFGNLVQGNPSAAISIISYYLTGNTLPDGYYPFPRRIHVHDNTLAWNGTSPDVNTGLGQLLHGIQDGIFAGAPLPDVIWDGIAAPDGVEGPNPNEICVGSELSWLSLGTGLGEAGITFSPSVTADPYRCDLPSVPAVGAW